MPLLFSIGSAQNAMHNSQCIAAIRQRYSRNKKIDQLMRTQSKIPTRLIDKRIRYGICEYCAVIQNKTKWIPIENLLLHQNLIKQCQKQLESIKAQTARTILKKSKIEYNINHPIVIQSEDENSSPYSGRISFKKMIRIRPQKNKTQSENTTTSEQTLEDVEQYSPKHFRRLLWFSKLILLSKPIYGLHFEERGQEHTQLVELENVEVEPNNEDLTAMFSDFLNSSHA